VGGSTLTVRLLEPGPGTPPSVLLGFAPTGVTDEEGPVVLQQGLPHLELGRLVDVLGVVGNDRLGDGGPDGVDLGRDPPPLHPDADVEVGELVLSQDEDGFEDLQPHDLRLDVLDGLPVDLDEAPALLGEGDGRGRLLPVVGV
jgi:hypothetical protein